jgi:MFS family permease
MSATRPLRFGYHDYASFLIFIAYSAGSVIVPVSLVNLAQDLGFGLRSGGMAAGGALHLVRTVPLVATMLVCGFMAGRWGNRLPLGIAVLLMASGVGLCAFAPAYGVVVVALALSGAGEGVVEGLSTPFVQRLHPEEPGRYINFSHAFWSVGVLATVLVSGALLAAGVSWRILVAGVALLGLLPAAMLLAPGRAARSYPEAPEPLQPRVVWASALAILRRRRFWLFYGAMFMAGGGEFCLTFWSASHIQLHFSASAWAGGLGTAFFAGGMVLGRTGWGYLVKQNQLRALILGSAAGGAVVTAAFPAAGSLPVFFALLFLAGIATAPFWPSLQSHGVDRLPGADATLVYILLACAGIPGCGFFTWLMGVLAGKQGNLGPAFLLVPACYVALGLLLLCDRHDGARS